MSFNDAVNGWLSKLGQIWSLHLIWGEDIHVTDVSTVVFKLMVFEFTCLRDEIAACAEKAYEHISFPEATRILYFESEKDMAAFAQKVTIILSNICRVVTSALILFKKILHLLRSTHQNNKF